MPSPSSSVVFWGTPYSASTALAVGNVVLPDNNGGYLVSTSANRASLGRRSEAIAVSATSGSGLGSFEMWQTGTVDATVSGLAVGTASWVRCSSTGVPERFTPALNGTSDVIGYCETTGRLHLMFGVLTETIIVGSGAGGASLSGTTNGVLYLSGANAGTADANFGIPLAGRMGIGFDVGATNKGWTGVYAATSNTETFGTATFPGNGLYRLSYFTCDGPFHGDSITLFGCRVSTDNTAGGAGSFDTAAFGVSGGVPFVGDPSHFTQTNIYGDGLLIDAGPGGGGAGAHPLTDHTGEIWFQCKATTAAGGFTTTYLAISGSGAPGIGVASFDGGNPSRLRVSKGTANQVLAMDGTGTDLLWTTPSSGFTAGGDLSGTSSSQTVIKISGTSPIAITPAVLQWVIGATSPTLKQIDQTAGSTNGQALTVQAQNATGVTSTGGALNLTSGTGTTAAGNVNLKTGGTTQLALSPTLATFTNAVAIGTNPAASGSVLRTPAGVTMTNRNNANTADYAVLTASATANDNIELGSTSSSQGAVKIVTPNAQIVSIEDAGVWRAVFQNASVNIAQQVGGYSTASISYRELVAAITQSNTTTTTLTAAQYQCPFLNFTGTPGGGFSVVAPLTAGTVFDVRNGTPSTMTFGGITGSAVTINTNITQRVITDGTSYYAVA